LISIFLTSILFNTSKIEFEREHYKAFYNSIIEDGDLNIVNQVLENDRWLVTQNYYHPTQISHGSLLFMFPFYINIKLFFSDFFAKDFNAWGFDIYKIFALIANAFFLWGGLLLLFYSLKSFFPRKTTFEIVTTLMAFSFTIPLIFYSILEPFQVEIICFFLSCAIFYLASSKPFRDFKIYEIFSIALFFSFCIIVKPIFAFFLVLLGWKIFFEKTHTISGRKLCALIIGFSLPLLALVINNYLQTGVIFLSHHNEVFRIIQSPEFLGFFHCFFSPNSTAVGTPILLIMPAVFLFLFLSNGRKLLTSQFYKQHSFSLAVQTTVIVFLSVAFVQGGYLPGYPDHILSRHFITIIPLFSFTFLTFPSPWRKFFWPIFICAGILHWLQNAQYTQEGMIFHYPQWMYLTKLTEQLYNSFNNRISLSEDWPKLMAFLPFFLIYGIILSSFHFIKNKIKVFSFMTLFFILIYFGITGLNYANGAQRVKDLKDLGLFKNSVVSNHLFLNYYDEITSIYEAGFKYLPLENRDSVKMAYEKYIIKSIDFVLVDPINFKSETQKRHFRPSLWNHY